MSQASMVKDDVTQSHINNVYFRVGCSSLLVPSVWARPVRVHPRLCTIEKMQGWEGEGDCLRCCNA